MEAAHHVDVKAHVRKYMIVFAALTAGTILTVAASWLPVSFTGHVVIALLIALVKGTLVAAFFMHLVSERKALYSILILTVGFFAVLLALPSFVHGEMASHPQIQVAPGVAPPAHGDHGGGDGSAEHATDGGAEKGGH